MRLAPFRERKERLSYNQRTTALDSLGVQNRYDSDLGQNQDKYGVLYLLLFGSVRIRFDPVPYHLNSIRPFSFLRSSYSVSYSNLSGSKIVFYPLVSKKSIRGLRFKHKVLATVLFLTSFALFSI